MDANITLSRAVHYFVLRLGKCWLILLEFTLPLMARMFLEAERSLCNDDIIENSTRTGETLKNLASSS